MIISERHPRLIFEIALSNASANGPMSWSRRSRLRRGCTRRGRRRWSRKVASIPRGLFAHLDYLSARGVPGTTADLAQHDLIGPNRALADREITQRLLPGIDGSRFVVRTDSHGGQLAAARAGLGIAVVRCPIGLSDPRLRSVLPELAIPSLDTWLVMHPDLRDLPRVGVVFDHLAEAFPTYQRVGGDVPRRHR